MVYEQMTVNPITLSFTGEQRDMEGAFQSAYVRSYINQIRIAIYLALIIICLFGMIDLLHVPDKLQILWFIRYGILLPLFISVIIFFHRQEFGEHMHSILAGLEAITGLAIITLMAIAGPKTGLYSSIYLSPGNLMLILFFGYLLGRIRFIFASIVGVVLLVVYNIMLLKVFGFQEKIFVTYNIYLGLFNFLGMFACYYLEYYERKSFYLMTRLNEEKENVKRSKEKTERAKANIEKVVRKRTREVRYREKDLLEAQRIGRISSWSHDLVTGELYWSKEFFRMAGIKLQKPTKELFFSLLPEEELQHFNKVLAEPSRDREEKETKLKLVRPDGDVRYINVRWKSLLDSDGNVVKRFGTDQDITEQVLTEEKLESARKMEALGFMAGSVAHDLNNTLTGLVSYPELLKLKMGKQHEFEPIVETIYQSGKRAAAIVSDLLTMARSVTMVKKPVNINQIIVKFLNSVDVAALKARFPDVTISINLSTELDNIKCSRTHIIKCLMNLVVNGAEAIEDSGKVIISTRNCCVNEDEEEKLDVAAGEYVVLSVFDSGTGIPNELKEHIFKPYYTKKKPGKSGTGLGLAIVSTIVDKHNGAISIDTGEHGTCINIYFPSTMEGISQAEEKQSIKNSYGSGEKILVIDDDLIQLNIAQELLSLMDYEVIVSQSGEEAINYLKLHSVDLVILDMVFDTGMGGREIFDEITKFYPRQKVIIVSGFSKNEDVEYIQRRGAGQYIKKPYSRKEIGQAIFNALYSSQTSSSA